MQKRHWLIAGTATAVFVAAIVGVALWYTFRSHWLIVDAQNAVRAIVKDPASVQFHLIKVKPDGTVCGEYNAKNGFGAYTGFTLYGYHPDWGLAVAPEPTDADRSLTEADKRDLMAVYHKYERGLAMQGQLQAYLDLCGDNAKRQDSAQTKAPPARR